MLHNCIIEGQTGSNRPFFQSFSSQWQCMLMPSPVMTVLTATPYSFKNRRANFPGRAWTARGVPNLARSRHNRGSTKLSTPSPSFARRRPHRRFLQILRISSLYCGGLAGFRTTTVQLAVGATHQQQQQRHTVADCSHVVLR